MGKSLGNYQEEVKKYSRGLTEQENLLKMVEELGEVVSALFKQESKSRLAEELGDLLICYICVLNDQRLDLTSVLDSALNKIAQRILM